MHHIRRINADRVTDVFCGMGLLTVADQAARLNLSARQWGRLLRGHAQPRPSTIRAVQKATGLDYHSMMVTK